MKNRTKTAVLTVAFLLAIPGSVLAEVATRSDWIPETIGMGDMWTFSCPKDGNFDLTIQNRMDGPGGASTDLAFSVRDTTGAVVIADDDTIPCTYTPTCGMCPQELNVPCGSGGTFSIQVFEYSHCAGADGGGYDLSLEVRDSANVALSAKKTKLGGGPKSKVPAWHSVTTKPAIDDGNLN